MNDEQKPIVKVCTHTRCSTHGSNEIHHILKTALYDEALVIASRECFDHCEEGPNVSVNGNVLHHITPKTATKIIREELRHPSLKSDGAGTRSLDDLDTVLEEATRL